MNGRAAIRHVILDRDGVLNAELPAGQYLCDWTQWRWLPGSLESLAQLHAAGIRVSVATNQSCVARGLLTRSRLDAIHARMVDAAVRAGGAIDHLAVCPHLPEAHCACRKPAPGLILEALHAGVIPPEATLVIGDDLRDVEAARRAGIAAVLVRTGKGTQAERQVAGTVPVFNNLAAFTAALLGRTLHGLEA